MDGIHELCKELGPYIVLFYKLKKRDIMLLENDHHDLWLALLALVEYIYHTVYIASSL